MVVFFALSPFLLVEPATAWQDVVANRQIVVDRAAQLGTGPLPSATAYARLLWQEGIGWRALVVAVAGGLVLAWRRPWSALLVLAFPAAFLLFISHTVAAGRYLNPVLPMLACLAGYALSRVTTSAAVSAALAIVLAWWPAWESHRIGTFFAEADTRTLALVRDLCAVTEELAPTARPVNG